MTADTRAPFDLRQEHGVETPEHVEVRLELAGVGSRTAAALLDVLLLTVLTILLNVVLGQLWSARSESFVAGWGLAVLLLINAFLFFGYFAICEAVTGGRTPGKQALGIRTVMDTGKRITPTAATVRALLLIVDLPLGIGLILMAVHRSNKRLGDMGAGTIVVRDRPADWSPVATLPLGLEEEAEPVEAGPPLLSNDEYRLLDQFLARSHDLDPAVQLRMQHELVRRFGDRVPRRDVSAEVYLVELLAEEQRRRRGRFATRARAGSAGRTTVTAERFVTRRRATWSAFDQLARRVERSGLTTLPPAEIPVFAARYREVTADLARARTYGLDLGVIAYLEGLVSAGHNALYRGRGRRRTPLSHYLLRDFPAAVVSSWRQVTAAFIIFAVPAAIGFALIRERPELTESLESPVMIDRAERAAGEQAEGRGYAQAEAADRPVMSAFIMGNNIRVSFNALAGGMLAGILTVLVLAINGFHLGISFGVFANHGVADHLATFIAGHGVLELTAIFISAGAGFRLAGAIIAPGDRTRRDALVVEGMVAARMIGAVASLLVLAGLIEGLLSASDAAPIWKVGVSVVTAVLLILYFANGLRYLRTTAGHPSQRRAPA
jgi:uncharacterized membrane protein SpoIIM required for sporulation/uncharacterized RDD family membrane protein YckC